MPGGGRSRARGGALLPQTLHFFSPSLSYAVPVLSLIYCGNGLMTGKVAIKVACP